MGKIAKKYLIFFTVLFAATFLFSVFAAEGDTCPEAFASGVPSCNASGTCEVEGSGGCGIGLFCEFTVLNDATGDGVWTCATYTGSNVTQCSPNGTCGSAANCPQYERCVSGVCTTDPTCQSNTCGGEGQPCCTNIVASCIGDLICNSSDICVIDAASLGQREEYQGPKISNLEDLVSPLVKILYYAGIFIGILMIMYAGYLFMASEGDPMKLKDAQEQLTAAILGVIFIMLSVFILRVIMTNIIGA